ncbi:MAG TPA: nucleoside deaminase [Alphaproteobacteria bacterium]
MKSPEDFMRRALALGRRNADGAGGGPFGAVIVRAGEIVGEGWNQVTTMTDPTAHAEIVAIRDACARLKTFSLAGCEIYTSCEPCPMCLGAILWARLDRMYYASDRVDAAAAGFDDDVFYREVALPLHARRLPAVRLLPEEGRAVFAAWAANPNKIPY